MRDIARAMAVPFADGDRVAKLVPEPIQGKSPPIAEAIEKEPRLKALYDENPTYRDAARSREAAGGAEPPRRHARRRRRHRRKPLWEYVPCFRPAGEDTGIVTQYDKDRSRRRGW